MDNLVSVLRSRKFWAALLGMLTALGVLDLGDAQQAETAATIAAGVWAAYTLAVALEDGLAKKTVLYLSARDLDDAD
jgi:hypothetical protein